MAASRVLSAMPSLLLVAAVVAAMLGVDTLMPDSAFGAPVDQGFVLTPADLSFILAQIKIAERHAATATADNPCGTLLGSGPDQIPNPKLPWGLRTVDGSCNNLTPGKSTVGAADQPFPRMLTPKFSDAESSPFGPPGGPATSYSQKTGTVFDTQPRMISNLIVDQTPNNPAARAAAGPGAQPDTSGSLFIPNRSPDVGLSPPYNSMFTLFGQFFDHGLDFAGKSGGTVFMPLNPDDPLYDPNSNTNFMVLTRATDQAGPDGKPGTADDVQDATNFDTPWADQSQSYGSHPSQQVFIREYARNAAGRPVSTGRLLSGPDGGMATWATVKQQARTMLGIDLVDTDVLSVPLLATDPYGRFIPGPHGYPQIVLKDGTLREGDPASPVSTDGAVPTQHTFLDDIAHNATPGPGLVPDADTSVDDPNVPRPDGTYDDELLAAHYVAGDGRVNENIGLTAIHEVFHDEHNRLVGDIKNVLTTEDPASLPEWQLTDGSWNGERLFQAARFVNEMEYQHLAFEEFVRRVDPAVPEFSGYDPSINPAITAEFAHSVYRFGHSMLTDTVDRVNDDGTRNDIPLLEAFLNPPEFTDGGPAGHLTPQQAAGSIAMGMANQTGNEIDEFVTDTLRNNLLGLPLDLASLNIARGRETGIPPLNEARRQFYAATDHDSSLAPYTSWNDFGRALRHHESLVNFVAAYGTHPSITGTLTQRRAAAQALVDGGPQAPADATDFMDSTGSWASGPDGVTTTGLDDVDLWVGGLAEKPAPFGSMLGPTFTHVFETQMLHLQDGDRFYYVSRLAGTNLLAQIEGNSFAEMIERNTTATGLPALVFGRPDYTFNLAELGTSGPVLDDPATPYDESALLTRLPDGTICYTGTSHVVFNGTSGGDSIRAGDGDDTVRGGDGADHLEGGAGLDTLIGGLNDDVLTDVFGDDTVKAGPGNDSVNAGPGVDEVLAGSGADLLAGGTGPDDLSGELDGDLLLGGDDTDGLLGGPGDDWLEGGAGADTLHGDSAMPLPGTSAGGDDVIRGDGGDDLYVGEGGNDIMVGGAGTKHFVGGLGFDWVTHKDAIEPMDADLNLTGLVPADPKNLHDRYDLVEGLSGSPYDDVLHGDRSIRGGGADNALDSRGIGAIGGLDQLLPAGATSFSGGNILLGGAGNDTIDSGSGNDVIDGDAWLDVQLRVPDPAGPPGATRLVDSVGDVLPDVFAGRINPADISVVRTIRWASPADSSADTVVFTGKYSSYNCRVNGGPLIVGQCPLHPSDGDTVKVISTNGKSADGTDVLSHVENLMFSDSVAPGLPAKVTATGGNASATVSWKPPSKTSVSAYHVKVIGADGTQVGDVLSTTGLTLHLTVPGLVNGQTYTMSVQATNKFGDGPWSQPTAPVTPAPTAPGAPVVVASAPGDRQVALTWRAPVDDGGADITGYQVKVLDAAGRQVGLVHQADAAATSMVVDRLHNGVRYRVEVAATNSVGVGSFSARSTSVRPGTVPAAPVIGVPTAGRAGGSLTATAHWNPPRVPASPRITGYTVTALRMASRASHARVVARSTASELRPGRRQHRFVLPAGIYRFEVVAENAFGPSHPSTPSRAVEAR